MANATRYGRPPFVVSARQVDRRFRVTVEDHGEGVPDALVPQLFDRFTRGHDHQGTGLGLAIARAYARAHGGDLVYERAGSVARFELIVPQGELSRPS
jgi:signal transduction histidine kinase